MSELCLRFEFFWFENYCTLWEGISKWHMVHCGVAIPYFIPLHSRQIFRVFSKDAQSGARFNFDFKQLLGFAVF